MAPHLSPELPAGGKEPRRENGARRYKGDVNRLALIPRNYPTGQALYFEHRPLSTKPKNFIAIVVLQADLQTLLFFNLDQFVKFRFSA
ncbi:hypothetical protein THTE_0545 [Thermogutta terrifontis]|uniref:Uncharacterized protein n=1 Tax=Thermogutta terrifontis TaxID=1331910 RepID=A0A286RB24_9BACT|nr:hypothetical protein THTE_0545 [Thermogutta terrifontis]